MQPWIEKRSGSSSSGGSNSTLHYDKVLSHMTHQTNTAANTSKSDGFRTANSSYDSTLPHYPTEKETIQSPSYTFSPQNNNSLFMASLSDGSDVFNFLNSTEYSDHIHGDDLRPDSMSYISHRHQLDTQHALSEYEKLGQLMETEDIVAYLMETHYTEDIYGIPILGQYLKQAKEEITSDRTSANTEKAIARLSMIRDHLVQNASGNTKLAAQNALKMNENDWSSVFLDSSIL